MHTYDATTVWLRGEDQFSDNRYSRAHEWQFDGGARIAASSSPLSVPLPLSVAANVDPEEALVAAASSCHLLVFLYLACKRGYVVESYRDHAQGYMKKNEKGRYAITNIVLRPEISFVGRQPDRQQLEELHHAAHEECYIANSLKSEIQIEIPN
jgi:organic hydroperoxide reductase OsmC/OhrA